MSRFLLAFVVITLSAASAFAQAKTVTASSQSREMIGAAVTSSASRVRALTRSAQAEGMNQASQVKPSSGLYANGQIVLSNLSLKRAHTRVEVPANSSTNVKPGLTRPRIAAPSAALSTASTALTQIYRVGVGDVLDVQLIDVPTSKSTLYTVLRGGRLDYPLAGDLVAVAGLTAEEIAAQLRARIKVLENPRVVVKVRDYASHTVVVTGLVSSPGSRFLRRENIPLYVVLSEAQPRPEAARATISRAGQSLINIDLNDQKSASTLLVPGDTINVLGAVAETSGFFYTGGAVNSPGQKAFHSGITLTQAVLASGGLTRSANNNVKLSRQAADGRLVTSEYNLRRIEAGKLVDPTLLRGDRITVSESH